MTFREAQAKAALLDLEATEFAGWCCLLPARGGAFVARAQTWEECLALLRQQGRPEPTVPLAVACQRCRVPAGQPCRNYRGQNKQTCPTRGLSVPATASEPRPETEPARPVQRGLFD